MARHWCEGKDEFQYYDDKEFEDLGGVLVHKAGAWHLVSGTVIEMVSPGVPLLEDERPVVRLGDLASEDATRQVHEDLDVAAVDAPGDRA